MNNKPTKLQQQDELEIPTVDSSKGDHGMNDEHGEHSMYDIQPEAKYPLSQIPRRIVAITVMLTIMGIFFMVSGIVLLFQQDYQRSVSMIILGLLMIIPGAYYSYQLYQFTHVRTRAEQKQILNEFPLD